MAVNFFRGHPSTELLPTKEVLAAAQVALTEERPTDEDEETRHPLTYGSDQGALAVRQTIAEWVCERSVETSHPITAACINLTNGASFGAASALVQCCPRDYTQLALAISPTYYLINSIFQNAGFQDRMKAVVESVNGIDLDGLVSILDRAVPQPAKDPMLFRFVLYVVPDFSNPGGHTLTLTERLRLLDIARKYNVLLLCDQVYDYLHYDKSDAALPSLVTLDRASLPPGSFGTVIANHTFSKYLGPGLRVGWQECATPELAYHLSQSGANKSGGSPSHMNTFIAQELIRSRRIDAVLAQLNRVYSDRSREYRKFMKLYLPADTEMVGGHGGYFFWLRFPPEYDIQKMTTACADKGIRLAPGQHFEVRGDEKGWGSHCFRVSLSWHSSEEAGPAFETWGKIAAQCRTLG